MNEKTYLREMAKRYLEIAHLPVMDERAKMWKAHNDGDRRFVPVIMEIDTFAGEIIPPPQCATPYLREFEHYMAAEIARHELVNDDKVVSPYIAVHTDINCRCFDMDFNKVQAGSVGYHIDPILVDLERDMVKLKPSVYSYDKKANDEKYELACDIFSDLTEVRRKNRTLDWFALISKFAVDMMTTENYFISMMDCPKLTHLLLDFITSDIQKYLLWQESEGLLTPNNGNDYAGAGSYGFTGGLRGECPSKLSDMWVGINSQESVGISSDMYGEFVFPYCERIAQMFGKVYYGCCEPVHDIWDDYVSKFSNLAKVSISAWCNEEIMGERLSKSDVIYSRKPSPNFIGVYDNFDEDEFSKHISHTLKCAKDCNLEIIFRDIYTLKGDITRAGRAVNIVRGLIS